MYAPNKSSLQRQGARLHAENNIPPEAAPTSVLPSLWTCPAPEHNANKVRATNLIQRSNVDT